MKTRKLSSNEILELLEREISKINSFGNFERALIIKGLRDKIETLESIGYKNKLSKFIDRNQGTFWFFIMITSIVFAVKVSIEAYLLK